MKFVGVGGGGIVEDIDMFSCRCLLLQDLLHSFSRGGRRIVEDMCVSQDRPRFRGVAAFSRFGRRGNRGSCVCSELLHISQDSRYDEPRRVWTSLTTTH